MPSYLKFLSFKNSVFPALSKDPVARFFSSIYKFFHPFLSDKHMKNLSLFFDLRNFFSNHLHQDLHVSFLFWLVAAFWQKKKKKFHYGEWVYLYFKRKHLNHFWFCLFFFLQEFAPYAIILHQICIAWPCDLESNFLLYVSSFSFFFFFFFLTLLKYIKGNLSVQNVRLKTVTETSFPSEFLVIWLSTR